MDDSYTDVKYSLQCPWIWISHQTGELRFHYCAEAMLSEGMSIALKVGIQAVACTLLLDNCWHHTQLMYTGTRVCCILYISIEKSLCTAIQNCGNNVSFLSIFYDASEFVGRFIIIVNNNDICTALFTNRPGALTTMYALRNSSVLGRRLKNK